MEPIDELKRRSREQIEASANRLVEVSREIHANPELAMEEVAASELLASELDRAGLRVERGVGGLRTAFRADAGDTGPRILICAEYDALPEIGHACGHNIIAAAALGAGLALAPLTSEVGFRVTVLGTPAEEAIGGKEILLQAGEFDDADAAMMIHPSPADVYDPPMLAVAALKIRYDGKEAHASAFPEMGVNALDAMNIAYTAIACLRQQTGSDARIHGIITKGGDAANVIPAMTKAVYNVRASDKSRLEELKRRVVKCFEAGAVATGATLSVEQHGSDYLDLRHNRPLVEAFSENAKALGRRPVPANPRFAGSTDMGNVSYRLPTIHPSLGIGSYPAVNHQAEFAAHSVSPEADKALVDGAVAMAWTALDLATDPDLLEQVKKAFQ